MMSTTCLTTARDGGQRRWLQILVLLATGAAAQAQADDPSYKLNLITDPPSAIYEVGQEAHFVVAVSCGDKAVSDGEVDYVVDDFLTDGSSSSSYPRGELKLADEPAVIGVTSESPGFLRCHVTYLPSAITRDELSDASMDGPNWYHKTRTDDPIRPPWKHRDMSTR